MNTKASTRRDFLRSSTLAAGIAAFPTIVPSSVFGKNAPSNRVTLAAFGTGGRGSSNCWSNFVPHKDVQFLAAADPFGHRRERFAARVNKRKGDNACKPYEDFREVLARKDIDGVVISTPDHWHVPLAYHAAMAGKDMYVEKPLGVAMAWAMKLREAVEKNKVVFQYGTQQRSASYSRMGMDLLRNGYVGEIKRVEVWSPALGESDGRFHVKPYGSTEPAPVPKDLNYDMWIGPAPMKPYTIDRTVNACAFHNYDYALGYIAGWGAHPLDIAQWGLDSDHTSPVRYEGTGKFPPAGALCNTITSWDVQCKYANGVAMRFMSRDVAMPVVKKYHSVFRHDGTTFFGTDGWVSVSRGGCYMVRNGKKANTQLFKFKDSDQHVYHSNSQARNFIDCIKSRKPTINPLESAIRADTISHMSDICIRMKRPIQWDPKKEQIVGDEEASKMLDRPMRSPWVM